MKRPVGVLALAILTFLEGVYQVYLTLIWLGVVGFEFAGRTVRPGEAQWGQALLAGILALLYFAIAYGFWTVRVWSWIYGVFITDVQPVLADGRGPRSRPDAGVRARPDPDQPPDPGLPDRAGNAGAVRRFRGLPDGRDDGRAAVR